MKRKILAVLGGLLAVVALSAFGPGAGCGRAADPQERLARAQEVISRRVNEVLDELSATPDQRAQILAIKDRALREAQVRFEQNRDQNRADRRWALQQLTSDAPDRAALYAQLDARADQARVMGRKAIDTLLEVNAILTPAQRVQLRTMVERLAERHGGEWDPSMLR